MINGKLGFLLALGIMLAQPIERWRFSGLGPVDLFIIGLMLTTWPVLWRRRVPLHVPLALPMWLIFAGSLIGALSGLDLGAAWVALIQEVYLFLLLVTLANAVIDRPTLLTLIKTWLIMAAFEAGLLILGRIGVSIPFLAGGGKAALLGDEHLSQIGRSVGTFINANAAGGFMMVSTFLLLAIPYPRHRPLRLGLILLLLGGVLSSGSNGALLGLTLGFGLASLYWLHHRGRAILFSLAAASLVITLLALSAPLIASRLSSAGSGSPLVAFSRVDQKLSKRLALWDTAVDIAQEHPTGIGPNVTVSIAVIAVHNDYIAFMSERGPLGLIGLLLLLGEVLFWLALAARDGRAWPHHLASGALLGGLTSVAAMAMSHEVTHGRAVWLLFAVIFLHYKFIRTEAPHPSPLPEGEGTIPPSPPGRGVGGEGLPSPHPLTPPSGGPGGIGAEGLPLRSNP